MKTACYLIVNDTGSVRTTKNSPDLKWNEVAIHLNLNLPNALFFKPRLNASISLDEDEAMPAEISVETINNVREAIQQATGMEIKLEISNPNQEENQ